MSDVETILKGRGINQVAVFVDDTNEELKGFYTDKTKYIPGTNGPYKFMYKQL
ncbi:MAG TPA: hypothetical protein VJJ82_01240 [Candidatus Nanoarchaeia archaeon]|nr:hypothetical protein [Candidatus Nanoarchaeia archaeon]